MITKKDLSVLFIVQAGKKFGTGHLKRVLTLASLYTKPFIWVITDLKETQSLKELIPNIPYHIIRTNDKLQISDLFRDQMFDLIVSDCHHVSDTIVHTLNTCQIPMITFDNPSLGISSEIHIAPFPTHTPKKANFTELYYTPINQDFFIDSSQNSKISNILISIGGSDPNNIAEKIVKALKDSSYKITVIAGALSNYTIEENENVSIIHNTTNISSYVKSHDLIFCGPGLTMLEVMAATKYMIVVAHTISQYKDLQTLPNINPLLGNIFLTAKKIRLAINKASIGRLDMPLDFHFDYWWLQLSEHIANRAASCPLCNSYDKKSIARNNIQNQFSCNNCKSTYLYHSTPNNNIEDSDNIIANNSEQNQQSYKQAVLKQKEDSQRRIQIIKKILPTLTYHNSYKLVDMGAEHGIFVQEANHNGFSAQGVELSTFAQRLARDSNNINLIDSIQKIYETGPIHYIVTVWKNFELLEDPFTYIKKLSTLLTVGGLLAFRIPIVSSLPFIRGFFRITKKGGELLAERSGFTVIQTTTFVNDNKEEFLEFYCIKRADIL